ncbi:hypothetical protein KXV85_000888, partial [Aspergillus fumigatus]
MVGSALAGLGGVMWGLYREQVHASIGDELTVLVFIVVIIGGLGSISGCFIGALLVAMVANYGGFLVPKLALVSNILLMPMMILSGDPPRSRVLALLLVVIVVLLLATPWLFPGAKAMNVAVKICVFAVLVASYDLLLGYTGTVSFAHTMFYGIGSYAIAIALYGMGPSWAAIGTGIVVGLPLAMLLALAIGLFSLRVAAIFFAMITLAVASAFQVLASQMSWLTGGEDGRTFRLPELLRP